MNKASNEQSSPPKNKKICFYESGFLISNMNIAQTLIHHIVLLIGIYWPNTGFLSYDITGFDSQMGESVPIHIIWAGLGGGGAGGVPFSKSSSGFTTKYDKCPTTKLYH